jgi:hypothetical protein
MYDEIIRRTDRPFGNTILGGSGAVSGGGVPFGQDDIK